MVKQTKQSSRPKENSMPKKISVDIPAYPGSRPLPIEAPPKGINIIELVSEDHWKDVLSFYQEKLSEKGWQLFASNYLEDRGTISFHPTEKETVTVLAASENSLTHIRIYIQN